MASRVAAAAFRRKTPSTGVPPPPLGPVPPPWTGVSPLYIARNVALGGAAGFFAYWSYTRVILPRVEATFRPAPAAPVASSRIEVLATPLAPATPAVTEPVAEAAPAHTLASDVGRPLPPPPPAPAVEELSPAPPAIRGDPWWLKWLPLSRLLELTGLSPWPFDYGEGESARPSKPAAVKTGAGQAALGDSLPPAPAEPPAPVY